MLFAAARLDHVNQLIAPNLESGKWVVSDRFHDSTRAYQGLTGGVDDKLIRGLEELALNGHKPDLTIVLDMDPESAFRARQRARARRRRSPQTGDRFEKEDIEWHRRLREAFLDIARNNPDALRRRRCRRRTRTRSKPEIWDIVTRRFPELLDRRDA